MMPPPQRVPPEWRDNENKVSSSIKKSKFGDHARIHLGDTYLNLGETEGKSSGTLCSVIQAHINNVHFYSSWSLTHQFLPST